MPVFLSSPPILPDWVPPNQNNNPSAGDINDVSSTLSERILTVSPWGRYVPIIFGEDKIGGIITLVQVKDGFLYLRLVWCIGEIEEIVSVTLEDGTIPTGIVFTHYTGTASQTADATLAKVVAGYADTLKNIGADAYNLAYTVVKVPVASLASFPRFIARIKGLKMLSPVPKTKLTRLSAASETDVDVLEYTGNVITITDNTDGTIGQFIRYEEDELINGEDYNFTIEVTAISDIGSGDVLVQWCGNPLIDDATSLQMNINAIGTYYGTASFTPYDSGNNYIRFDVTGANVGVSITYEVTLYNALGNAVSAYSDVAGVALNHLFTDTQIGLGLTTDLPSLVDLINRNSSVLASGSFSESRSAIGLSLTRKAQLAKHIEVMRGYARCNVSNTGGNITYFPLQARAVSFSLTVADIKPNTLKPVVKDAREIPNIVRVYYTDTYTDPWKDNFVEVETSEVTSGAEYKREAVYRMNGFQSRTAALRFAYDRINERLRFFDVTFRTHESCYDAQEGQTFNLTHPRLGATTHKMRLISKKKINISEWEIFAEYEDDNIYSNEIADYDPSAGTITAPDPFTIIEASNLTLTVEIPQMQSGIYSTRLRAVWVATTYTYNHAYLIELYEVDGDLLLGSQQLPRNTTAAVFPNIQENVEYRVELKVIGFATSTGISDTITPTGKDFPPSDVTGFNGYEVNGTVTLKWADAVDNNEISHYYIQYGLDGFVWGDNDSRVLQSRVDAREIITNNVPSGTWDFRIKAVDNVGNESTNSALIEALVVNTPIDTVSTIGYVVYDSINSTGLALHLSDFVSQITNNYIDPLTYTIYDYVTKNNDTWANMFISSMSTYTDPLMSYGIGESNVFYSLPYDYGSIILAKWEIVTNFGREILNFATIDSGERIQSITGNQPIKEIQLSDDGITWVSHQGLAVFANARYVRLKVYSADLTDRWIVRTGTFGVNVTRNINIQSYSGTTISGTKTIDLDSDATYFLELSVNINEIGSNYAIIEKVGSSPYSQVKVTVYDETGSVQTSPIDISGKIRYI